MWVTLLYLFARPSHQSYHILWSTGSEWWFISLPGSLIMSHPITNRLWVILLYLFTRQSHQSCFIPWLTNREWGHCFIFLPGSLINHISSHDQQWVSDTALFLCQAVSLIMSPPMTNREWVTLLYLFARQSHKSYLGISWPTASEWHCFISLPSSSIMSCLIYEQHVGDTAALFLCQAISSIIFHATTNREWVTLLHFLAHHLIISWSTCRL